MSIQWSVFEFTGTSVKSRVQPLTCGSKDRAWHFLVATLVTETVSAMSTVVLKHNTQNLLIILTRSGNLSFCVHGNVSNTTKTWRIFAAHHFKSPLSKILNWLTCMLCAHLAKTSQNTKLCNVQRWHNFFFFYKQQLAHTTPDRDFLDLPEEEFMNQQSSWRVMKVHMFLSKRSFLYHSVLKKKKKNCHKRGEGRGRVSGGGGVGATAEFFCIITTIIK